MRIVFNWLALAGVVAGGIAWQACKSPVAPNGVLLMGQWGSDQGFLNATRVSTQFNGTCGTGNTNQPLMLDKHGHFDMVGVYGRAGAASSAARFVGSTSAKQLQLRVVMADSTNAVGPIMLDLGQQPALATCR